MLGSFHRKINGMKKKEIEALSDKQLLDAVFNQNEYRTDVDRWLVKELSKRYRAVSSKLQQIVDANGKGSVSAAYIGPFDELFDKAKE